MRRGQMAEIEGSRTFGITADELWAVVADPARDFGPYPDAGGLPRVDVIYSPNWGHLRERRELR
jgi:hypothetical protein